MKDILIRRQIAEQMLECCHFAFGALPWAIERRVVLVLPIFDQVVRMTPATCRQQRSLVAVQLGPGLPKGSALEAPAVWLMNLTLSLRFLFMVPRFVFEGLHLGMLTSCRSDNCVLS